MSLMALKPNGFRCLTPSHSHANFKLNVWCLDFCKGIKGPNLESRPKSSGDSQPFTFGPFSWGVLPRGKTTCVCVCVCVTYTGKCAHSYGTRVV